MFRLRLTTDAQPRTKNGQPPHSTTGSGKNQLNPLSTRRADKPSSGLPGSKSAIAISNKGSAERRRSPKTGASYRPARDWPLPRPSPCAAQAPFRKSGKIPAHRARSADASGRYRSHGLASASNFRHARGRRCQRRCRDIGPDPAETARHSPCCRTDICVRHAPRWTAARMGLTFIPQTGSTSSVSPAGRIGRLPGLWAMELCSLIESFYRCKARQARDNSIVSARCGDCAEKTCRAF